MKTYNRSYHKGKGVYHCVYMDNFISPKLGEGNRTGRMREWTTKLKNACGVSVLPKCCIGLSVSLSVSISRKKKKNMTKWLHTSGKRYWILKPEN